MAKPESGTEPTPEWVTSSYSTVGNCVQARKDGDTIRVRNSNDPDAKEVNFTVPEWEAFRLGVQAGEFDFAD